MGPGGPPQESYTEAPRAVRAACAYRTHLKYAGMRVISGGKPRLLFGWRMYLLPPGMWGTASARWFGGVGRVRANVRERETPGRERGPGQQGGGQHRRAAAATAGRRSERRGRRPYVRCECLSSSRHSCGGSSNSIVSHTTLETVWGPGWAKWPGWRWPWPAGTVRSQRRSGVAGRRKKNKAARQRTGVRVGVLH